MQFGPCLARHVQQIWKADPKEGSICLSKWDISDALHWCNLSIADVGKFDYMVPPITSNTSRLLCIYLVLPMGWFKPPDFF